MLCVTPTVSIHIDQIYKDTNTPRDEENDAFLRTCTNLNWSVDDRVQFQIPTIRTRIELRALLATSFPHAIPRHDLYGAYTHIENDIDAEIYDNCVLCTKEGTVEYLLKCPTTAHKMNLDAFFAIPLVECVQEQILKENEILFHQTLLPET